MTSSNDDDNVADVTTKRPLISCESVVPLGIAATVVIIAATSAWQVSASLTTNNDESRARFERIESRLLDIDAKLALAAQDRWRRADMQTWIELMRAKHPEIAWRDVQK